MAHTLVYTAPEPLAGVIRPFLHEAGGVGVPSRLEAVAMSRLPYVADFDSASAMLRALACSLRGQGFSDLGLPSVLRPVAIAANSLPHPVRREIYKLGGLFEAISPRRLERIRDQEIAQWVVSQFPERQYPAVLVGASNGALTHLAAALGAPWLPQTFLIPVRHLRVDVDQPRSALEFGREHAPRLLDANPDLQLHQMHDPCQDRLMAQGMAYFRIKRRSLGEAYERFLRERLAPGGAIILVDCRHAWPTTSVGPRHVFQFGGSGGPTPQEYLRGSPRVAAWMTGAGLPRQRWDAPEPDGESPEAEWGFEDSLGADVERIVAQLRCPVVRIVFDEPQDASPFVAELYRWWYRQRGLECTRLLVESFILMDPWWTLRLGAVPFWAKFNTEPAADGLERYLDAAEPYDVIDLTLFSHGVSSIALAAIERWQAILARARRSGSLLGVDPQAYPSDFAVFARYHPAMRALSPECPLPQSPLTMDQLKEFVARSGDRFRLEWKGLGADPA